MSTPELRRQQRTQARISRHLGKIGFALPGSLTLKAMRCGTPGCRCHTDPDALHGPYWLWTRKVKGKTVTKMLRAEQVRRYKPWFDNWRKLRALLTELEEVSLHAIAETEGWEKANTQPGGRSAKRQRATGT